MWSVKRKESFAVHRLWGHLSLPCFVYVLVHYSQQVNSLINNLLWKQLVGSCSLTALFTFRTGKGKNYMLFSSLPLLYKATVQALLLWVLHITLIMCKWHAKALAQYCYGQYLSSVSERAQGCFPGLNMVLSILTQSYRPFPSLDAIVVMIVFHKFSFLSSVDDDEETENCLLYILYVPRWFTAV